MRTEADRRKQLQTMADAALHKRNSARKLLEDAEEELRQVRMLIVDFEREVGDE